MIGERIAVTGGAGFIGSNLINKLIERKHEVLSLDNLFVGKRESVPDGCHFHEVDVLSRDARVLLRKFEPDVVIHLAAVHYIPYCNANPERTFEVNVMGTRNILESCEPDLFFFASSAAVYPNLNIPLGEELSGPIDIYGKTKLIGEDLVKLHRSRHFIGRFFNVYGSNDLNPHLIPEIVDQIKRGLREIALGNLTPKRDYIHVDDVTDAIIALLNSDKYGTYNIGTGIEHSVLDIIRMISEDIGEDIRIIQDKERLRKVERESLAADNERLRSAIGWQPRVNFKDGICKLIRS
ncbi:MAG TPA: NAD(P)-dependent oxidoreductase [Methanotrichaceae archaeon]|nr:MAG: UDP-galactose-4-epimerase [Methanosaeta sp. PtaU1.Bin028]HQF15839.1 NAD(P)-dependent oxidoreductase [Methanotrichaceae archaeon]HQI90485.1 NAD(P)-dependent oxidoreductase [Methanotrichaceae archaeon]HQJ28126.1 NAD(P)-dependent oxidoreductase [Methanotrichaceae archaeon]